jgi:hypothetical protein
MKISRLFVLIWGIFVPVYILFTFWSFDFKLTWLPLDWSWNSQTVQIIVNYAAPIFYCVSWLYFNILLGSRIADSIEIMAGTSSGVSTHYIVFYGVNAIVLLLAFLIPVFSPIVGILSFSSLVYNLMTSKTSWDDMSEKQQKTVKTVSILSAIPIIFVSIFVVPDLITLSLQFSKNFWEKAVNPLFWAVKAYGVAIPIGNFIILYRTGVAEVEGRKQTNNNLDIYFIELVITAFLFFLESQGVEFVTFLYYAGMVFWVIAFIANLIKGKSKEGKWNQNPIALVLNAIFWVAWFIFGSRNLPANLDWVKLALTIVSALVFFSAFLIIFIGHPDLDE